MKLTFFRIWGLRALNYGYFLPHKYFSVCQECKWYSEKNVVTANRTQKDFQTVPMGTLGILQSHWVSVGEGITKREKWQANLNNIHHSHHPFFSSDAGPPQPIIEPSRICLKMPPIINVHIHTLISNVYFCLLLSSKKSITVKEISEHVVYV